MQICTGFCRNPVNTAVPPPSLTCHCCALIKNLKSASVTFSVPSNHVMLGKPLLQFGFRLDAIFFKEKFIFHISP